MTQIVRKSNRFMMVIPLLLVLFLFNMSIAMAESWTFVDGNGAVGLNSDPSKSASSNPSLVDFNGEAYAIWSESVGSTSQIRVKKYNGSSWVSVDNNTGLNKDLTKNALVPALAVFNNELYAAWQEIGTTGCWQIRVKKYNGSSWDFVDGGGANGINQNTANNGKTPVLVVYNNSLY